MNTRESLRSHNTHIFFNSIDLKDYFSIDAESGNKCIAKYSEIAIV